MKELPDNYTYPASGITHADIKKFRKIMYLPILTKPQNSLYDRGWERIFGKKQSNKSLHLTIKKRIWKIKK